MQNRNKHLIGLVVAALMVAISLVAYFFKVPLGLLFGAGFLKLDFSDLPAIIGGIYLGPIWGIAIEAVKNILSFLLGMGASEPIGEFANFIAGSCLIIPLIIAYRMPMRFLNILSAYTIAILFSTLVMCFVNHYINLPVYGISNHAARLAIIYSAIIPFNLLKGMIICISTHILVIPLKKVLKLNAM